MIFFEESYFLNAYNDTIRLSEKRQRKRGREYGKCKYPEEKRETSKLHPADPDDPAGRCLFDRKQLSADVWYHDRI